MKKIVSLLLTIAMLCCSLLPALAEASTAPTITVDEFKTAMDTLAKVHIDWDLTWIDEEGICAADMATNPILVYNEAGYVTNAMVAFSVSPDDDVESMTSLFIIVCALTAAAPAVRDGVDAATAPDLVWADLQTMLSNLTSETQMVFGNLYGATAIVMLAENEEGGVDMSMIFIYNDPTAEVAE